MSEPTRQILTPGAVAAPAVVAAAVPTEEAPRVRAKPGPKPRNPEAAAAPAPAPAAGAADDLAEFDTDDLPPQPAGASVPMSEVQRMLDEQAAAFRAQIAEAIHAAKSSQDPATAAKLAAQRIDSQKLPTQEAALAMQQAAVDQGLRPRAILTDAGWVVHREMARSKDPMIGAEG